MSLLPMLKVLELLVFYLKLFKCPECQQMGSVLIEEDILKRKGLASNLEVKCSNCTFKCSIYTSKGVLDNQGNGDEL